MQLSFYYSLSLLLAASHTLAHSVITGAIGDQGGNGSALGVDPSTPRDGTGRNPFQQDATRFSAQRGDAADTCGSTLGAGDNDVEAGTTTVMQQSGGQLPQVSAGGQVMMTLHQVNSDGAGPYTCEVDASGQGTNFQPMTVTQNVEGNKNSRNRANSATDLPLTAQMPAGTTCSGTVAGQSGVCMVRCMNGANAGPFGGCVPVQMASGATNSTAAGAGSTAAAAGSTTGKTIGSAAGNAAGASAAIASSAAGNSASGAAAGGADGTGAPSTEANKKGKNAGKNGQGATADDEDDEEDPEDDGEDDEDED